MPYYDFCFAWSWQYDIDFVEMLDKACQAKEISIFQVTPDNLEWTLQMLEAGDFHFQAFFDRASDGEDAFYPLVEWAVRKAPVYINPYHVSRRAWNKADMYHKALIAGLNSPLTLVVPSQQEQPDLYPFDLTCLGERFVIKPANGGGGSGVMMGATCFEQVIGARQEFPADQYLLQSQIVPALLDGRKAWFRVLYASGEIFPCWWDPCTHVYDPVQHEDLVKFDLDALGDIVSAMSDISQMDLFSTEIAFTDQGSFEIIDYVNDPIDLRPQSKAPEGVPDGIVQAIAYCLADHLAVRLLANSMEIPLLGLLKDRDLFSVQQITS